MTKQAEAKGIHAHSTMKLGRRPPTNAPALEMGKIMTGATITHPAAADHFHGVTFTMGANDRFGVCGPTGVCNEVRLVSKALLGSQVNPSLNDEFDLYRRSGNPGFNPNLADDDPNQEDNGVVLQTMLEALLAGGIGDGHGGKIKPVAFGRCKVDELAEIDAGVSIFGGALWGVDLETAQQAQTSATPPRWVYKKSSQWGGHCVMNGKFEEKTSDAHVISWDEDVETDESFRSRQLQEVWFIIWPWNLAHPAFQAGIDLSALRNEYKNLTGRALAVPTTNVGKEATVDPADEALWAAVRSFTSGRQFGRSHVVQDALKGWAYAKGYLPKK